MNLRRDASTRALPTILLLLLCLIAASLVVIGNCTGSIIVDGFQSLGAVASSEQMGDLHWPLVGSYLGYDQCWGFHWPGWPLLRSWLVPILPWHPLTELLLLTSLWACVAWHGYRIARSQSGEWAAVGVGFLIMGAPGILITSQNYRPEVITALMLMIALRHWSELSRLSLCWRTMALLVLPLLHPLGTVVPAAWIAWTALMHWQRTGWLAALRNTWAPAASLGVGLLLFAAWFAFQPQAWQQFQCNLEAQKLLGKGLNTNHLTIFRWLFGGLGALPLVLLLLVGMGTACVVLWRHWRKSPQDPSARGDDASIALAGIGLLAAFLFNWLLKNPNANHFTAIVPLAVILFVVFLRRISQAWSPWMALMAYGLVWALSQVLLLKYAVSMAKNVVSSYRGGVRAALASLPSARKVWIPVAFWEAAILESRKGQTSYQFSTFPNVLASAKRRDYEQMVLQDLQAGDLLLWDPLQEKGGVFNFVTETAMRHLLVGPTQQPDQWEKLGEIKIPVQYSRGQATDFVLYRKK